MEGGSCLKHTEFQKTAVQQQFDCFCKKALREKARDYIHSIKRRSEKGLY